MMVLLYALLGGWMNEGKSWMKLSPTEESIVLCSDFVVSLILTRLLNYARFYIIGG